MPQITHLQQMLPHRILSIQQRLKIERQRWHILPIIRLQNSQLLPNIKRILQISITRKYLTQYAHMIAKLRFQSVKSKLRNVLLLQYRLYIRKIEIRLPQIRQRRQTRLMQLSHLLILTLLMLQIPLVPILQHFYQILLPTRIILLIQLHLH